MKYSYSVLALAGAAMGTSILERQVTTIVGVVNGIDKATQNLDSAVKSFSSDPSQLLAASSAVSDAVQKGVQTVNGASSITLTDSVSIQSQVSNLQSTIESVVNDLISKKDALVSAGQGGAVEKSLQDQLTGAKALQSAISSKVPPEVQSLAQQLSAGINVSLQKGVDAFAGTGSSSSGSSSGSSMPNMPGMPGMSGSSGSPGSPGSSGSGTKPQVYGGSSSSSSSGARVSTTSSPKPAMFTGAAPRTVAGPFTGFLTGVVTVFAAVIFVL